MYHKTEVSFNQLRSNLRTQQIQMDILFECGFSGPLLHSGWIFTPVIDDLLQGRNILDKTLAKILNISFEFIILCSSLYLFAFSSLVFSLSGANGNSHVDKLVTA